VEGEMVKVDFGYREIGGGWGNKVLWDYLHKNNIDYHHCTVPGKISENL